MRHLPPVLLAALALLLTGCPAEEPLFPEGFLWGTASSGWQVEGDEDVLDDGIEVRSNWTVWAERGCVLEGQTNPRGSGFRTMYADDFALAASLGNNAYRLGIEWARVEPEDDAWNQAEIDYYVDVVRAAREAGLEPMVTWYHWVIPTWVQNPTGGADAIDHVGQGAGPDSFFVTEFEEFVARVAPEIGPYVDLYSIMNEPFSVITAGYLNGSCGDGAFPPGGILNLAGARNTFTNLAFGHAAACHALRDGDTADSDGDGVGALCGHAPSNNVVRPLDPWDEADIEGAAVIDWISSHATMAALIDGDVDLDFDRAFDTTVADNDTLPIDEGHYPELVGTLDWHGINYYGPIMVDGIAGSPIGGLPLLSVDDYDPSLPHSSLGYAIDAPGFGESLDAMAAYGLPIYVTENGIGDTDDSDRPMFVVEHVEQVQLALERGIDMRGYFHWSLTDNFEWSHGTHQRFGLFEVDFDDPALPRTRRGSADTYQQLIEAGGVTDEIREAWVLDRYPSDQRP